MSLQIGDALPDLTLSDQEGQPVRLHDLKAGGWLVLFFYPKDETRLCTQEVCGFRDAYQDFRDAGAEVVGISSDDAGSHRRFAAKHQVPFRLLSDPQGQARQAFGVPRLLGIIQGRTTYVIDARGIIRLVFTAHLNAENHIRQALALLRNPSPSC